MNFNKRNLRPPVPGTPSRNRRLFFFWLSLALYCGLLFWQSSQPNTPGHILFRHEDKVLHMAAFAVLALLFARALAASIPGISSGRFTLAVTAFILLFGMGHESYQYFIPTRNPGLGDLAADIIGGMAGTWFYLDIWGRRK